MKILIIEDDELKHQHLDRFVSLLLPNALLTWKKSYQSGLQELMANPYDLILLDMSMDIYEKTAQETGGSFETYAGRMLLNEMDINEIQTKVIVVTGFDVYGDGKTLETLKKELRDDFGDFYLDTVYFIASEDKWKTEITQLIKKNFPDYFMSQPITMVLSILLVEDSEYKIEKVRNFINQVAPKSKILVAKDQIAAQKYLLQEKFDLMLLDMQLPNRFGEGELDADGGENILRELEINDNYKQPDKIVALTEFENLKEKFNHNFDNFSSIKFDTMSDKWKESISKHLNNIQRAKTSKIITIYCENQNDFLYNAIGLPNVTFIGIKDSRAVFLTVKNEKDKFGLRDKDLLTLFEVGRLKEQFKNYLILDYYCFENYLYHPDNLAELQLANFNKEDYVQQITKQKNEKLHKILYDLKETRKGYAEMNDTDFKNQDRNPELIVENLMSNDFDIFYPFFDMKGENKSKGFDRTCLNEYNLDKKELVKTKWFEERISKVLSKILNHQKIVCW